MSDLANPIDDAELNRLVEAAFRKARDASKDDWSTMSAAVLKNRILQLDPGFDESRWQAGSFTALLKRLPSSLVEVDSSVHPPTVTLNTSQQQLLMPSMAPTTPSGPWRVRSDYWHAVFGEGGYWHPSTGRVVAEDPQIEGAVRINAIPKSEIGKWRTNFDATSGELARGRSRRDAWLATLKRHIVDYLQQEFAKQGQPFPRDAIDDVGAGTKDTEVERLRQMVIQCVHAMTSDELRALSIPATAVDRLQRAR